jgi:hypothetical protein
MLGDLTCTEPELIVVNVWKPFYAEFLQIYLTAT